MYLFRTVYVLQETCSSARIKMCVCARIEIRVYLVQCVCHRKSAAVTELEYYRVVAVKCVYMTVQWWWQSRAGEVAATKDKGRDTGTDRNINLFHLFNMCVLLLLLLQEISSGSSVGQEKLQAAQDKGSTVLPQTSSQGQELIKEELAMLVADFEGFDVDLTTLTNTLSEDCGHSCAVSCSRVHVAV